MTIVTKGVKKRALASLSTRSSILPLATTIIPWQNTANKSSSISAPFSGSNIVVTVTSQFAGAISSITWDGVEFVNNWDHGREFQSAVVWDLQGECNNPTEAGSRDDLFSTTTTSVLGTLDIPAPNQLITTNLAAYWIGAGQRPGNCGPGGQPILPGLVSNTRINKTVTIGIPSAANVIKYDMTFVSPDAHTSASFEIVAGYTRGRTFVNFWTYHPSTQELAAVTVPEGGTTGSQVLPMILSTADSNHAIGLIAPHVASVRFAGTRFTDAARTDDNATTKINCATGRGSIPADSTWPFTCYIVVGTIADVQLGMLAVNANE